MIDFERGLTSAQVQERVSQGQVNLDANIKTRSVKQILFENIVSLFNIVNCILAVIVCTTGSYKNMLFMFVIIINVCIGIIQELRSKRTTDRLSIVAAGKVSVVRDGELTKIPFDEIVLDDILVLGRGNQVPADCVVVDGTCDANESLLTGESDLIHKSAGDELMSGSFVNSGTVHVQVRAVGADSYANRISAEAKQHKKVKSEIMDTLNKIVKYVSISLPFVGIALFWSTLRGGAEWNSAILSTVAAMVGMIPEGLILLTSTVLAVAVIRLSQSQVLVQQLYCIETLARVDTLCLDKTGTITTGEMEVASVEPIGNSLSEDQIDAVLFSLVAADEDPNETSRAIKTFYEGKSVSALDCMRIVPFSSDKKWSGAVLADGSAYCMGAGQFILGEGFSAIAERAAELAEDARLLVLAQVEGFDNKNDIQGTPLPVAFICIHDQIRSTAAETINYFKEQGVCVNVISGDDPRTVSGIAAQVGVEGAACYVDATTLKTEEDIADAMERYHVFGRVKPEQKKQFVVALQKQGHIVAMTGDGVNDTLALKQADCSVAMAAGSDAARNVAHLVLVNNDFASMPKVVAEGRRSINNLQRSASLFLVKTIFSVLMAVLFVFLPWAYPFQPIQMTLVSAMTIGFPSFVLALEPNKDRIKGHFLTNVIVRAIPGGLTVVATVLCLELVGRYYFGWQTDIISSMCVLFTAWIGVMLIVRISRPFTPIRAALLVLVVLGVVGGATILKDLFCISTLNAENIIVLVVGMAIVCVLYNLLYNFIDRWYQKQQAQYV